MPILWAVGGLPFASFRSSDGEAESKDPDGGGQACSGLETQAAVESSEMGLICKN